MNETQYISDFLAPRDAWDKLSIEEQAAMMKTAISEGILDLGTIRQKYNEFAEGGNTDDDLVDWIIREEGFIANPRDIGDGKMTLGSGLTAQKWHDQYKRNGNKWTSSDNRRAVREEVANRRRWAERNIPNWDSLPSSSQKALLSYKYNYDFNQANSPKLFKALADSNLQEAARQMDATSSNPIFKKGLQDRRQREQEWFLKDVASSQVPYAFYQPAVSTQVYNPYVQQVEATRMLPINEPDPNSYIRTREVFPQEQRRRKFQENVEAFQRFNALMDLIDLRNNSTPSYNPIYSLIGGDSDEYANGGKIHIKPENRGKFTALKERTGHSASWFKAHGTPAQKKMATFALNARKWKHGLGGNLFSGKEEGSQQMITTGGAGYIPSNYGQGTIDYIRRRLYRNITPFGYHNPVSRTLGAVVLNQQDDTRIEENKRIKNSDPDASALDAIWATYLNIPENQRRNINSKYGISKTKDGYYRFNSPGMMFNFEQDLSPHGLFGLPGRKAVMMNGILGNYTTGLGRDTKGDYIFYSDSRLNPDGTPDIKTGWDINPYSNTVDGATEETTEEHGQYGQDKKDLSYRIGKTLFGNVEDISMGIGTPVPIYDKIYLDDIYNVPWKERGGYYLPEITVTGRKKKALGGNLFDGNSQSTQKMKIGRPYYSYDENGRKIDGTLNYNISFPEVVIIPDSKKSPAERAVLERERRRNNDAYYGRGTYNARVDREQTELEKIASQKAWENSIEKQALGYAQAAATGVGIGADIVSGLPIYSSLKGVSTLNRAETPLEYIESGLWLTPMLGGTYKGIKPIFKTASKPINSTNLFEATQFSTETPEVTGRLLETQQAAEKGRNKLLGWIQSPFYKQRLEEEPFYRFSNDIANEASTIVKDAPLDFSKTVREIDPSGNIAGTTKTRPALKVRDDGYRVFDLNTGLDVNIGSDLGSEAEDTTLHELLHYLTVNSKGIPESTSTMQIVDKGWMQPLEALYNPVGKNILRGKKWQNYILDQNDALLPKYDSVVDMVMNRPDEAKAALLKAGRTEAQADIAIKSLQDRYAYWADIQEQRAHLQELFISKIKPHLKNPNDAAEIESFLSQHPEILENSAPYNYIQEVRPGSLKQYAGYFASALSTLPFINKMTKE